jgi:hypothetical protein
LDRRLGRLQKLRGRCGEEKNLAPTGTRKPTPWPSTPYQSLYRLSSALNYSCIVPNITGDPEPAGSALRLQGHHWVACDVTRLRTLFHSAVVCVRPQVSATYVYYEVFCVCKAVAISARAAGTHARVFTTNTPTNARRVFTNTPCPIWQSWPKLPPLVRFPWKQNIILLKYVQHMAARFWRFEGLTAATLKM